MVFDPWSKWTEQANFHTLYSLFYRRAFLFAKSYVHDRAVAEDIASESILSLWSAIEKEQVERPAAMLLTIVKNNSLNYLRHKQVECRVHKQLGTLHDRELDQRISTLEACSPEALFSDDIQRIVARTLDSLSPKTRRIFEMSRYENLSNDQIAAQMDLGVKSIEYHVGQALKSLRKELSDYLDSAVLLFFLLDQF